MAKGIWGSEWPPWLYYRKVRQQNAAALAFMQAVP